MQEVEIQGAAAVSWQVRPIGAAVPGKHRWLAQCQPLKMCVEADTLDDLDSLIVEVMNELFRDLLESGDMERFLRDRGWRFVHAIPRGVPERELVFRAPVKIERDLHAYA